MVSTFNCWAVIPLAALFSALIIEKFFSAPLFFRLLVVFLSAAQS
jgi:hypothetical protein